MEEKRNARYLPRAILEEKRQIVHRLRRRGMTRAEIGEVVGIHADTIGRWLKLESKDLGINRGGRKTGDARLLSAEDEQRIRTKIIDRS